PDGKRIVSCAKDGTVRCWDTQTGKQLWITPDFGPLGGGLMADALLSPDGKYLVTLYAGVSHFDRPGGKRVEYTDRVARVWEAATGKQLSVLRGHQGRVRTAAFSAAGKRLVTTSYDTTGRVWEVPSGKQLAVLQGHACTPYSACFSPDGRQVWTVSSGHEALIPRAGASAPPVESDPEAIRTPQATFSQGYVGSNSG